MPELQLPGPDGASIKGLLPAEFPEVVRLSIFMSDLRAASELLGLAANDERSDLERDAFCLAALVKLLGCFESTVGHRQKPLKPKKILNLPDRRRIEDLRQLRNKIAVHDEQLYPMNAVVAAVMPDATIADAYVLKATAPLHQVGKLLSELTDLCPKVADYVWLRLNEELGKIVEQLNAQDLEWRQRLLHAPDFSTTFHVEKPEEARWKRP